MTLAILMLAITVVAASGAGPADAQTVSGEVRVIDGDTFQIIGGPKVRIFGMDTLEKGQQCRTTEGACVHCGRQTTQHAIELIGKAKMTCELRGEKSFDREVASCTVNGKDYALSMIADGWGLAYRFYLPKKGNGHPYVAAEEKAKATLSGLWGMTFVSPADWRNRKMRLECER